MNNKQRSKKRSTPKKPVVKREPVKKEIVVAVSGGFDPVHLGHLFLLREAKELGTKLVVIVNGDLWLERKKGRHFMTLTDRMEILRSIEYVDAVVGWDDGYSDVSGALELLKPAIFANGGDREDNLPEEAVCRKLGINMVFGVGGGKIRSSSELLREYEMTAKHAEEIGEKVVEKLKPKTKSGR